MRRGRAVLLMLLGSASAALAGTPPVTAAKHQRGWKQRGKNSGHRTAMCITGEPRGVLRYTIQPLVDMLVDAIPSRVDVFVASTPKLRDEWDNLARSVVRVPDPPAPVLTDVTNNIRGEIRQGWVRQHDMKSERLNGFGHHGLWGFLLQLNSTYTCLRAVEEYERLHHFRYDFAGRSRIDMRWFEPIPRAAWSTALFFGGTVVAAGFDSAVGLNDRFILTDRNIFGAYARIYPDLTSGLGVWRHPDTWRDKEGEGASRLSQKKREEIRGYLIDPGTSNPAKLNAEKIMGLQLMYAGARIIRLPLPFCVIAFKKNSGATCPACKRGDNPVCRRQLEFCRAQGLDTNTTCAGAPDYAGAVHKRLEQWKKTHPHRKGFTAADFGRQTAREIGGDYKQKKPKKRSMGGVPAVPGAHVPRHGMRRRRGGGASAAAL